MQGGIIRLCLKEAGDTSLSVHAYTVLYLLSPALNIALYFHPINSLLWTLINEKEKN